MDGARLVPCPSLAPSWGLLRWLPNGCPEVAFGRLLEVSEDEAADPLGAIELALVGGQGKAKVPRPIHDRKRIPPLAHAHAGQAGRTAGQAGWTKAGWSKAARQRQQVEGSRTKAGWTWRAGSWR